MKRSLPIVLLFINLVLSAQTICPETVTLPTDAKWGGGDVKGSVLIGNTYGPGQGPGIYIVADGGYRLYLNGELLAYDNAAGRVQFIPMTFLPLKNSISVVGINGQKAPGVLIQIDELEKSYYSGNTWKVNTNPADNSWKNKTYNDASWASATTQTSGSVTQTPSGVTFAGFPSTSTAKWIWSGNTTDANAVVRFTFEIKPQGFAAATTGGDGSTIVVITSKQQFLDHIQTAGKEILMIPEGTYDFREFRDQVVCNIPCNSTLPTYHGNATTGVGNCQGTEKTIQRWDKLIWIKGDKTIIGMGRGASLRGGSFYSGGGQSNIIFRNLKVWDVNPHIIEANDGIGGYGLTNLWVDHCTFKWISDGSDQGDAIQTWSWNMIDGLNEFMCSGHDHYAMALGRSNITFDHMYWYECEGRDPDAAEYNKIHIINNYHENNKYYAVGGLKESEILVEGSVFDNVSQPLGVSGNAKLYQRNNQFNNCGPFNKEGKNVSDLKDAVFTPPYSFTVENLSTVANNVKTNAGCGGRWKNPLSYGDAESKVAGGPTVSISSPANGFEFNSQNALTVTALATKASKVVLYLNDKIIGEDATSPYEFALTGLNACTYSLQAVAYDSRGVISYSIPVIIKGNGDCNGTVNGTATLDNCGRCIAGTTGKTACTSVGEAETEACAFEGITETKNTGFKGTSYLNVDNAVGTAITFNITATNAGSATLSFRYANGGTVDRPAQISLNGTVLANNLSFPVTGTFTDWKAVDISLTLQKGSNTIKLLSATAEGLPNIDQIGYVSAGVSKGSCVITGTSDIELETLNYQLYPNPSKASFYLNVSKSVDLQVMDINGKLCEEYKNVSNVEFGENLKAGIYFLKIENKVYKLVKE